MVQQRRAFPRPRIPAITRFWRQVRIDPSGCWLWTSTLDNLGYAHFRVEPGSRTKPRAHRWMWEQANGPIPKGMCVLHRCDVRHCVNPNHLWLGTQRENIADRDAKGRNRGLTYLLEINRRGGPRSKVRPDMSDFNVERCYPIQHPKPVLA